MAWVSELRKILRNMKTKRILITTLIVTIGLSSCVSKKKYLDMESSKMRAEQRVRELTDENEMQATRIAKMIAEYEAMKQDLLVSNAQKDEMISNLNSEINGLKSNVQEKDETIEEKLYAFAYEKRQLNESLEKDKSMIEELKQENKALSGELSQTKETLADTKFSLSREKSNVEKLNGELQKKDGLYEAQMQQIASLKADIQKLKVEAQEKDETIERLNNNVSLLKSKLN